MPAASTPLAPEAPPAPFVPPISREELARRNAAAIALLDEWEADASSEQDQRETMDVLRRALGPGRIASDRPAIS
jgi:hypothetical protein